MLHKNTNKYIFVSYTSRGPKIKQLYGPCNYYLKTIPYVRVVNIRQKWLIFSVLTLWLTVCHLFDKPVFNLSHGPPLVYKKVALY